MGSFGCDWKQRGFSFRNKVQNHFRKHQTVRMIRKNDESSETLVAGQHHLPDLSALFSGLQC
jgi:hypothetical protein